jgi:hypothetical protein
MMSGTGESGEFIHTLTAWVSANAFLIVGISAVYFAVSLLAIRYFVIRMPADHFVRGRRDPSEYSHPFVAVSLRIAKNFLGVLVIVVGLVMSLPGIPGQGFLTLLIGLTLTDFPGKRKLELWILRQPVILRVINGVRERAARPPLLLPEAEGNWQDRGGAGGSSDG